MDSVAHSEKMRAVRQGAWAWQLRPATKSVNSPRRVTVTLARAFGGPGAEPSSSAPTAMALVGLYHAIRFLCNGLELPLES